MRLLVRGRFAWLRGELRGFELEEDGYGGGGGERNPFVWDVGDGGWSWDWGVDSAAAVEAVLFGVGEGRVGGEYAGEGREIGGGFEELRDVN